MKAILDFFGRPDVPKEREIAMVFSGDGSKYLVCNIGTENSCYFTPQDIINWARREKINTVIMAHNHPPFLNGVVSLSPSIADIKTTVSVQEILAPADIDLMDHFIVDNSGPPRMVSLKNLGYYNPQY